MPKGLTCYKTFLLLFAIISICLNFSFSSAYQCTCPTLNPATAKSAWPSYLTQPVPIIFDPEMQFTETQKDELVAIANGWAQRYGNITFYKATAGQDQGIYVTSFWQTIDSEVGLSNSGKWPGTDLTKNQVISLNDDLYKIPKWDLLKRVFSHEVGHGFGQADPAVDPIFTNCTAMNDFNGFDDTTSGSTSPTSCDDYYYVYLGWDWYCSAWPRKDNDGDGYFDDDEAWWNGNWDCDDENPDINPGALELCDGIDENCNAPYVDDELRAGWCPMTYPCVEIDFQIYCATPIIIDLGNGSPKLTGYDKGVYFDLNADGVLEKWSWTEGQDSKAAFLALDLNGNGIIDSGRELFGNTSRFPRRQSFANGFEVLRYLDTRRMGGNFDGIIDDRDAIYSSLLLWVDINHNGFSESAELLKLSEHIKSLEWSYKLSERRDRWGNVFRFRGKVHYIGGTEKYAWDVILMRSE